MTQRHCIDGPVESMTFTSTRRPELSVRVYRLRHPETGVWGLHLFESRTPVCEFDDAKEMVGLWMKAIYQAIEWGAPIEQGKPMAYDFSDELMTDEEMAVIEEWEKSSPIRY